MISLINVPCDSPAEYYQAPPTSRYALTVGRPKLKSSLSSPQLVRTQRDAQRRVLKSSSSFNRATTKPYILPAFLQQRSPSHEWRSLFCRRRTTKHINYLGARKTLNGQLMENKSIPSSKLWEVLLLRSFAHKMENEIKSPIRDSAEFFQPPDGQVSCVANKSAVRRPRTGCMLAVLTKMLQGVQKDATTMGKRQASLISKRLRCLHNYRPFTARASYSPAHA